MIKRIFLGVACAVLLTGCVELIAVAGVATSITQVINSAVVAAPVIKRGAHKIRARVRAIRK